MVDLYESKDENFGWYKVVSTHQVAHLEFGSFLFQFDLPSSTFQDKRSERESILFNQDTSVPLSADSDLAASQSDVQWTTDMGRYFALFNDRQLALDCFTLLEDGRQDNRVMREYPGIKRIYQRVQTNALEKRPAMMEMPIRQAMVELLVRISLEQ